MRSTFIREDALCKYVVSRLSRSCNCFILTVRLEAAVEGAESRFMRDQEEETSEEEEEELSPEEQGETCRSLCRMA